MNINRAEQYAVVVAARNHFTRCRTDEILSDPMERAKAFIEAFKIHPSRLSKAFYTLSQTGGIDAVLEMDDLLRKSAETIADEEWFSNEPVRIAA